MAEKHGFDIGGNLRKIMLEHKINASQLGNALNLSAATIKKIRLGGNLTIGSLKPIADYFKITISQLIGNVAPEDHKKTGKNSRKSNVSIPVIGLKDALCADNPLFHRSYTSIKYKSDNKVYALILNDDFHPIFQANGLLFIDPEEKYSHNDYVLVQKNNQQPNIKRIIEEDGIFHLQSVTVGITTFVPLNEEFRVLGTIVGYNKWFRD